MKSLLLSSLFLLTEVGLARASQNDSLRSTPGIENNVRHRLRQLGHDESVHIFSISIKGDSVYALPVMKGGKDLLWEDMHVNKTIWIKNPSLFTRIFHGKGFESWRSAKKSSLHIIVHHLPDKSRYYEMHIDNWAPKGVKNPVNSVRHIFAEVLWNAVTRRSASQERIARGLTVIDEKNKRKP